jgi:hypothetical protein
MPNVMIIKDEHITEAENLLINGDKFDSEERIPFIKKLSSCDLLAVPGSGKTTALLAKLYCISKQLPFNDGSGILVLSHTNAAVDEIENNLRKHCSNLFTYPNFIGTVQSFVNKFLASQACFEKYGSYISINDNDIYEKEAVKFFYSLSYSATGVEPKNLKNKLIGRVNHGIDVSTWPEREANVINFLKYFELDIINRKVIYNETSFYTHSGSCQSYYLELEKWKESLYGKGLLNYKDSFYLGNLFLELHPEVKKILQNRFKYVFIDEMQDLEKFQIDIIDKIFFDGSTSSVIQRIGDVNQSIYSSSKKVKVEADWIPRNQIFLNGSNRLTQEISSVVNYFTLDRQLDKDGKQRFVVNGLRSMDIPIKPHIVLFDYASLNKLEGKFKELILNFSLQDTNEAKKYGFKIIGWNAKWGDDEIHSGQLRLENIFETYKKEAKNNKETYDSLSKYLQFFDHEKKTLEPARKAVLNSLIHVLRIEGKTNIVKIRGKENSRYYSKDGMIKFIKNPDNNCDYEYFKKFIYACSYKLLVKNEYELVYNKLKEFVSNKFKKWFDLNISTEVLSFLGDNFKSFIHNIQQPAESASQVDDIKIDIGTVHSSKGQTHCATMYIETSYYNYETNKLKVLSKRATKSRAEVYLPNPLFKQEHAYRLGKDRRAKEALKMMYVGFSRPTHLLCFACLKENMVNEIENIRLSGWEIIDLTINN